MGDIVRFEVPFSAESDPTLRVRDATREGATQERDCHHDHSPHVSSQDIVLYGEHKH
jgi:hypothetical protein